MPFLNPYTANGISFRSKLLTYCPSPPFSVAFHCPAHPHSPPPPPLPPPPLPSQLPSYNAIQLIRKWDTVCFNTFCSELLKGPSLLQPVKRYWNLVLKCNALNHIPLLFPLLPEHHPPHITTSISTSAAFTSVKRNIALKSCSCTFHSMWIFLNLTANIIILGTYTHFC